MSVVDFQASAIGRGPVTNSRIIGTRKKLMSSEHSHSSHTITVTLLQQQVAAKHVQVNNTTQHFIQFTIG